MRAIICVDKDRMDNHPILCKINDRFYKGPEMGEGENLLIKNPRTDKKSMVISTTSEFFIDEEYAKEILVNFMDVPLTYASDFPEVIGKWKLVAEEWDESNPYYDTFNKVFAEGEKNA